MASRVEAERAAYTVDAALNRRRKVGRLTKLGFASGSLEEALVGAAYGVIMIFYNQVLGVRPAWCGIAFLIASTVDAISDPLVGAYSDSVQTRWGRRHPFMLAAALPLALAFYLLYQPPGGLSELSLVLWMSGAMVLLRLSKTFYAVPHSALGAELTDDYDERTSIFGYNTLFMLVGTAVLTFLMYRLVFASTEGYENGLLNPAGYALLAPIGAVFALVMILVCAAATWRQIPYLHRTAPKPFQLRDYFANLRILVTNPSYLAVSASWLVMSVLVGVTGIVSTYTFVYAFALSTEEIAYRAYVLLPAVLIALPLASFLTRRLDKKRTVILCVSWFGFLAGLPFALRLVGWFPENESAWLVPAIFGIWTIAYLVMPVIPIAIDSQLVDLADEHELRTGQRSEGMIFSVRTFALKLTSGLGGLLAGFGLELIGFPRAAEIDRLDPHVIQRLLFLMGPVYWIGIAIGTGFSFLYRIDRKRHEEILRELEQRRVRTEPAASGPARWPSTRPLD